MSPRRTRQLLGATIIAVWGVSGLVLYWGWTAPLQTLQELANDTAADSADDVITDEPAASGRSDVTLASFQSVWDRPLRRVLYDPPPPPEPEPPPKKPPPRISAKVLATMTESNQHTAMLQLNGGQVVFRRVGESVSAEYEAATISEIKPGLVIIRQGEHLTEYAIDGGKGR